MLTKADSELTDLVKFTLLLLNENLCIITCVFVVSCFFFFLMHLGTVAEHIERIYRRAGSKKLWFVSCSFWFTPVFFPNVFIENVNWILMNFKGKEKRAAFLTKLYWFIAAKHLVYNALKKLRSISCLLKYKRIISWLC